jgi:DNA-binding transcriptional LysR family regulator
VELRHLRSFVAVAEELHFGRAAERLHLSRPPLTQQIKALEQELGTRLLDRTSRSVELTDVGRTFLEHARRILQDTDRAVDAAQRTARGELGWLTLGFVDSAAYALLPRLLRAFRARHPDVRLDLRELATEPQLALIGGGLDLGVVRDPRPDDVEDLVATDLEHERLVAVLPDDHRLVDRVRLRLADLATDRFVMVARAGTPSVHDRFIELCLRAGFSPHTAEEAHQYPTMVSLVAAGYGVAVVPACVTLLPVAGVAYVPLSDPDATSLLALVAPRGPASPAADAFLRTATEVLRGDSRESRRG